MNDFDSTAGRPWYRYFWPWFIVALLCSSVAGGVATVVIAFANQDSLVSESWYESGMQINRRLESEQAASRRSIRAKLWIDDATGEVRVELAGEGVEATQELDLELSHPTLASRDQSVSLARFDADSFRGQLGAELSGRWYAALVPTDVASADVPSTARATPVDAGDWRLSAMLELPSAEPIIIGGGE
jgi:hypothetical protein